MSKYYPKCKHNFSDAFDECVYCGSELKNETIEIEDIQIEKQINTPKTLRKVMFQDTKLAKAQILKKYLVYQKQAVLPCGSILTESS